MIEVVVFIYLYSMCCSIIEDRVCVFGVCFFCDISTEIPHRIFVVVEGAFTAETSQQLERIENKLDDMASVDMPMSEATLDFSASLLSDLKIKHVMRQVNMKAGEGQMKKYP